MQKLQTQPAERDIYGANTPFVVKTMKQAEENCVMSY